MLYFNTNVGAILVGTIAPETSYSVLSDCRREVYPQ